MLTDQKPLTELLTIEMNNTEILRWVILVSELGCKIKYTQSKNNVRTNMLSRIELKVVATYDGTKGPFMQWEDSLLTQEEGPLLALHGR